MKAEKDSPGPRLLMVATVASTARAFLTPYADAMRKLGWEVDLAAAEVGSMPELRRAFDEIIEMPWSRSIWAMRRNFAGWKKMRRLFHADRYDLVHTHTPIASFVTRFACIGLPPSRRPKLIYTAHGFHFHRNRHWLPNAMFKMMEKIAGQWTDTLIVINREDEAAAKRARLVGDAPVVYLPGIGIDIGKYDRRQFSSAQIEDCRRTLRVPPEAPLALMVAEFNPGKRHAEMLKAMALVKRQDLYVAFAGTGPLLESMRSLAKELGVGERCRFLGLVSNIPLLCASSQLMTLPSEREGLPRALMEGMAAELPIIGADSRGIRDLLENGCGLLHPVGDVAGLAAATERILETPQLASQLAASARRRIAAYEITPLLAAHQTLYGELLKKAPRAKKEGIRGRVMILGGEAQSLVNFRGALIKELRALDYQVIAVASDQNDAAEETLRSWGVRYHRIHMARAAISPIRDAIYYWKLADFIAAENCDVIIAYTHKPILYGALAKAKLSKRKHAYYAMVTGLGYAFTKSGRDSLHKWISRTSINWMYKRMTGHIDGFIFQNQDDQAEFSRSGVVRKRKNLLVVRGSGVDLDRFPMRPFLRGKLFVLLIARLISEKGIREWIEAARILTREKAAIEFHLVGPFDANPSAISDAEVRKWQEERLIVYHGMQHDVRPYLAQCSVYVLPSYREGTPRTVLEAMATGRAIVTTDAAGCRDTIFDVGPANSDRVRQGRNGMLVPVGDASALAAAIRQFVDQPSLVVSMGEESRRLAEKYYDVRKVNANLLEFMLLAPPNRQEPDEGDRTTMASRS